MFNLLYSLLILRPCFGAFNPELVETFQKNEEDQFQVKDKSKTIYFTISTTQMLLQDLILDTHFIGSSQSGRTYAGCVRSRSCSVLSQSRLSDTCDNCAKLAKIVINRSVLTTSGKWQILHPLAWNVKCTHLIQAYKWCLWLISLSNQTILIF